MKKTKRTKEQKWVMVGAILIVAMMLLMGLAVWLTN